MNCCVFFTKYFEGYRELIKSIDNSELSPILKGMGKFLATLKVIFDMFITVLIPLLAIGWLVELIL